MRIIPFPQPAPPHGEPTLAEIEVALHDDAAGPSAEQWRELRSDVRSVAPPMSPELERELWARVEERVQARRQRGTQLARLSPRRALAGVRAWLGLGPRVSVLAGAGACIVAAILALVVVAPWRGTRSSEATSSAGPAIAKHHGPFNAASSAAAAGAGHAKGVPAQATPVVPEPASANQQLEAASGGGRVQQLGASLTLAPKAEEVQSVADQVAQVAAREGGFVQTSHVQVQAGKAGEASIQLSLPSARLSAALAALSRLAPTRAESQSLQDITDEYDAAKRKLADAVAERQALLRALSRASTQGEIESLHARLSLAAGAITRDREAFASVSKRGSNSAVEVTVLGDAHASGGGGLTLGRAVHDAGDVLRVALSVAIIALAALVPLAILLALIAVATRATRRRMRERALS